MTGIPQTICSDVFPELGYPLTAAGLIRCARDSWRELGDQAPRLVIDGAPIPNGFVVHTRAFRFKMPARNNVFRLPGVRGGRAASAGRIAIIKPLAPGRHTLIEGVKYRDFHNQVIVYNLDVV
jgi:hypothetical protein